MTELITVAEAARRLKKEKNKKLLMFLIDHKLIPSQKVGPSVVIDARGFERLTKAVEEWDRRPKVTRPRKAPASA